MRPTVLALGSHGRNHFCPFPEILQTTRGWRAYPWQTNHGHCRAVHHERCPPKDADLVGGMMQSPNQFCSITATGEVAMPPSQVIRVVSTAVVDSNDTGQSC